MEWKNDKMFTLILCVWTTIRYKRIKTKKWDRASINV